MKDGGKRVKDDMKPIAKSPCSVKTFPVPEFITCPKCGGEIELWSDEERTECFFCGHKVFKKENIVH
jgi:rRNA maturation endonuclease Nob1